MDIIPENGQKGILSQSQGMDPVIDRQSQNGGQFDPKGGIAHG